MIRKIALAGVALAFVISVAGPAAAKVCKPFKISGASKPHLSRALRAFPGSLIGWKRVARRRFGAKWSFWSRAEDKTIRCHQIADGADQGKWLCIRSARPCSGPLGPERGPVCQAEIVSFGARKKSRLRAREEARSGWIIAVRRDHGEAYTTWSRAHARDITCRRIGAKFQCVAAAEPCRS